MEPNYLYCYDPVSNQVHRNTCKAIKNGNERIIKYPNLSTALRKKYIPCKCCQSDYRKALRERNIDIISRTKYNFIYSSDDEFFHKRNCQLVVLLSADLQGTHTFNAAVKTGREPCPICKPLPQDIVIYDSWIKDNDKQEDDKQLSDRVSFCVEKAVNRHSVAQRERRIKLMSATTQEEIDDIYTLTQPRYSFWTAKGYKSFHLKSCALLSNLTHLIGFQSYNEACREGYKPCRKCKPTSKHDLKMSIPIYSKVRKGETLIDLEKLCHKESYYYLHYNNIFIIQTSNGKWRIHIDTMPIKVEHINTKKYPHEIEFHRQPRIFLSLSDVFFYIKRHDNCLK